MLVGGIALLAAGAVHSADLTVQLDTPKLDVPEVKLPPGTKIPEGTKQLVDSFQQQARVFIERQKDLWKQAKGASAEEKQKLIEQIRSSRQNFLDQTRDIRSDIKERIKELKENIKETRPQINGAGESGGRCRHGGD